MDGVGASGIRIVPSNPPPHPPPPLPRPDLSPPARERSPAVSDGGAVKLELSTPSVSQRPGRSVVVQTPPADAKKTQSIDVRA